MIYGEEGQKIDSPWITREEASEYAKCSKYTIDNWLKAGYLQYLKTSEGRPGRILIEKSSLEKFLAAVKSSELKSAFVKWPLQCREDTVSNIKKN